MVDISSRTKKGAVNMYGRNRRWVGQTAAPAAELLDVLDSVHTRRTDLDRRDTETITNNNTEKRLENTNM